jgi:hypothetical protein
MSDIANLLIGAANNLPQPESTSQINADTYQNQLIRDQASKLALQKEQRQAQIANLQQKTLATKEYLANPEDVHKYIAFTALNPEAAQGAKEGYNAMGEEAKKVHLSDLSSVYGYSKNGTFAPVVGILKARRASEAQSNQDTSATDAEIDLATKAAAGDKEAANQLLALSQHDLGSILPADQFKAITGFDLDQAKIAAETEKTKAETTKAKADAYRTLNPVDSWDATGQVDANGNPTLYNKATGETKSIGDVGIESTGNTNYDLYKAKTKATESSGNPNTQNPMPGQTASGLFGFTDATWRSAAKQTSWGAGKSDAQLDAMKDSATPAQQNEAFDVLQQDNANTLARNKIPVAGATLYMAHNIGPAATTAVLNTANPDVPLSDVLKSVYNPKQYASAMKGNPEFANMTVGSYADRQIKKFGMEPINPSDKSKTSQGNTFLNTLDPDQANLVDGIAKGDIDIASVDSTKAGRREALIKQVKKANPNWDAGLYDRKQATMKSFMAGDDADAVGAINTVFGHALKYNDLINERKQIMKDERILPFPYIPDIDTPTIQGTKDFLAQQSNNPRAANLNAMDQLKLNVSHEEGSAYKGSKAGEKEVEDFGKVIKPSAPIENQRAGLYEKVDALVTRLNTLAFKYNKATQTSKKPLDFLEPETKAGVIKMLKQKYESKSPPNRAQIEALQSGKLNAQAFDKKFGQGRSWIYLNE